MRAGSGCNLTPYVRDLTRKDALRPPSAGVAGSAALEGKLPEAAVQGTACGGHVRQGGGACADGQFCPITQDHFYLIQVPIYMVGKLPIWSRSVKSLNGEPSF